MVYLTRQERAMVLFITGMAMLGVCINFAIKVFPEVEKFTYLEEPQCKTDINRAGISQLQELKGIGPVLAATIVAYRSANGPFLSIEGLRKVRGIGESKYEQIKELVVVNP